MKQVKFWDHRSYGRYFGINETKARKIHARTVPYRYTGASFYQLSYRANWKMVIVCVRT